MRLSKIVATGLGMAVIISLIVCLAAIARAPNSPAGTHTNVDTVPSDTKPLTPEAYSDVNATDRGSVAAEQLTPDFTYVLPAVQEGAVQFEDATRGGTLPRSYTWDFDGDGVADSTDANPSHAFPGSGEYEVTLTVASSTSEQKALTKTVNVFPMVAPVPEAPTLILVGSGLLALVGFLWLGKRRMHSRTEVA